MEKSKMQLVKEWIETCPLLKGDKINVDYLKDDIDSYSIDQVPVNPVKEPYIDGTELKQIAFDFTIQAPISSKVLVNLTNSKFCEDFQNWIKEQNNNENLPQIPGIEKVECTSPGYVLQKTETTAIYIIQMNCQYYEGGI